MGKTAFLESFDLPEAIANTAEAGPTEDWLAGHAAGVAQGLASAAADDDRLAAELAQTLTDMAFGYAEARAQIVQRLRPLFAALMERLLPELAQASLAAHLVERVAQAASADAARPLQLAVHPTQVAALDMILTDSGAPPVRLRGDPSLGTGQAILQTPSAETMLDLDGLVDEARGALAALFDDTHERTEHG